MQGHPKVIEHLNQVLTGELTAINQYFIHGRMCDNWGYARLGQKIREESIDEMKHADRLIERILYLEGVPNLQRLGKVNVGQTVPEQFTLDLELEKAAILLLNEGVELARGFQDNGSRELFEGILVDEERHADWLETQISLIEQVGSAPYLAEQIRA